MFNLDYLTSIRDNLLERGTFTIAYLKWAIKCTEEHKFLKPNERDELIACYNILLAELQGIE